MRVSISITRLYSNELTIAVDVSRFTLYDNCGENSLSIDGITQDLDYEILNLTCLHLNCVPKFSNYRVYLKNESFPQIIIAELKVIRIINPPGN